MVDYKMESAVLEPKRRGRKRKKVDEPDVMDINRKINETVVVDDKMETLVVEPKRRGRKRKKVGEPNVMDSNRKIKETRSLKLVGGYVRKEFPGNGIFLGRIMSYDAGLYRVNYEDGDFEDMDSGEVKVFLVEDHNLIGEWSERKTKLDELLLGEDVNAMVLKVENTLEAPNVNPVDSLVSSDLRNAKASKVESTLETPNANPVDSLVLGDMRNGEARDNERKAKLSEFLLSEDVNVMGLKVENTLETPNVNPVDSLVWSDLRNGEARANALMGIFDDGNCDTDAYYSTDSCEDTQEPDANIEMEEPLVAPPELPPSSGHIGVHEEFVSHLLSVHGFLRSFSVQLFLYPFGLDDFVGALNCSVANTLLDSVHVALLRVMKRHIERLLSDGSELASKCIRCADWSLLDNLTWPVYLVHYLMVMCCKNGPDWKEFYAHSLERDYYTLSAGKKLAILQILCDDVLDSEELREEIGVREESEVGVDIDTSTVVGPSGGSRRFHPRYYKTSAPKSEEALMSIPEHHDTKPSLGIHSIHIDEPVGSSVNEDSNGDECRICGMDGLLVCCDGCPSSYHSRCLGLNKMHMPEGSWYCPECKINATEPKILQGTRLRGGHNFGIDPYGQVFVATCDHLLVLNASNNSGVCPRYYNRHDIPRVVHCLCSNAEHVITYLEICKGIMQYWELPEAHLPGSQMSEVGMQEANEKVGGGCNNHLDNLLDTGSCENGLTDADTGPSNLSCCAQVPILDGNSLDKQIVSGQLDNTDSTRRRSSFNMSTTNEPVSFGGLMGQPADTSDLRPQSTSSLSGIVSYTTRSCHVNSSGPVYAASQETKMSLSDIDMNNRVGTRIHGNPYDSCFYMGSSFKTTGYINNYLHGDFAASAASSLAIISSEENQVHVPHSSYNRRKGMSGNISLQVKAFSSAAVRFFWPNSEKKLVDIPRERCTWCFSCKAPVASKKGCLLNAAALYASRGSLKVLAGVRHSKNGDSRLPGIATYILHIEESLSGLVVGPFLNDTFRKKWRKQVEQASTCSAIKILLLELEENVRAVAFSGDWVKLVDGCSTQSSHVQISANAAASSQKRKPGRRGRRLSAVAEVATDDYQALSNDITWWRGGTLSKLMFQRGIPSSMIRKAARQVISVAGGSKKIPGLHYVGGHETPKSSRQLIWRSAVDMSRNMAQLALQIRYLDFHVRWSDLVRPEQTPPDGKGPDAEASAYRNAFICDKKIVEQEVRYCVAFGSQKHLPSRLLKNIAEVEKVLDDGKERYWFSETRIPLYLIKDYEEKAEKSKSVDVFSKLQRRQRKASRKNIFSYLSRKQDSMVNSYCCSCHQDVLHRNAVKCSACEGLCHENCATSSTVHTNNEVEFFITCKHCCETRAINQVQGSYGSPTSPLLLQVRDVPKPGTSSKRGKVGRKGSPTSVRNTKHSSVMGSCHGSAKVKKSNNNKHWGLIWLKNNCEDTGVDFRLKNILLRGNPDMHLTKPSCRLCNKPYNADLMYIRCEACQLWFHADALELNESKISCLVGYKCCKCRRIKSPECPYLDLKKKKIPKDKKECRTPKLNMYDMDSNSRSSFEPFIEEGQAYSGLPANRETTLAEGDDNLLLPLSEIEQCTETSEPGHERNDWNITCSGPRKLTIRRHIKQANGKLPIRIHVKTGNESDHHSDVPNPSELNATTTSTRARLSPPDQLAVSKGNSCNIVKLDNDCLGYGGTDFEPQTYFSFHELFEPDEGSRTNGNEFRENVVQENWEDLSVLPGNDVLEISYDEEEPIVSMGTTVEILPCNFCCQSEPYPDLSCHMCGIRVHSHCSPWLDSLSSEDSWRCGNCRE
ncbi:hypothetical protein OROGR_022111 [Orobanche gracilis]